MKRTFSVILFITLLLILTVIFAAKPLIRNIAESNLRKVFTGSKVSIGGCTFKPSNYFALHNITIDRQKDYSISLKELKIDYTISSLLKKRISKAQIRDVKVDIKAPKKHFLTLGTYLSSKPSAAFSIDSLAVSNLNLRVKTQDLSIAATVSAEVNLAKQVIDSLELTLNSFDINDAGVRDGYIAWERASRKGDFFVKQFRYGKIRIEDIHGKLDIDGRKISFEALSARIADGHLHGIAHIGFGKEMEYAANLRLLNLDGAKFVDDFSLEDNFLLKGKWEGDFKIKGTGFAINYLDGNLMALSPGGSLTIVNKEFLNGLAANTGLAYDILVERFKDYHYNRGVLDLSLENGDLLPRIFLEGEKGKSNFNINIHNFLETLVSIFKLVG